MHRRLLSLLICVTLVWVANCSDPHPEVTFTVTSDTLADDTVYIAGSHETLGAWNPAAVPLKRAADGTWRRSFRFVPGQELEYKFTRGAWSKEALAPDGRVPQNSTLRVTGDTLVEITITGWRDSRPQAEPEITGSADRYPQLDAGELPARDVIVWLPPGYEESGSRRYPVLYMHDGQNVFDPGTSTLGRDWRVDEVADSLIRAGELQPLIVVAVSSSDNRTREYSDGPAGQEYLRFLVEELKPFIDGKYRTETGAEHTGLMGASMGGLISFLGAWYYPDVFSRAGCLSPAFIFNDYHSVSLVEDHDGPMPRILIYMDNGEVGLEADLQPGCDRMLEVLQKRGYQQGEDLIWFLDRGAEHNEMAWARRVHKPLLFMFGTAR